MMSSSLAGWIESLPLEIKGDTLCIAKKIDFDFSHIECVDNYLFLWKNGYSPKILRIHLETKHIEPIIIPQNIKIDSLKVISKNNQQCLLISENRIKSQIHLINLNDINNIKSTPYQAFSSQIIQIEYTSISSNTIYVLTHHNFSIIGLNDECNNIVYHDRINVFGKNVINFCLGSPKHLHDKLFNEYNFSYGFSKFAGYFINKFGEIYVCSPIIPNKFQCTLQNIDALKFDTMNVNDDEEEVDNDGLYDLWINRVWNICILNENNTNLNESILNESQLIMNSNGQQQQQPYTTFDAKAQFIYNNEEIYRELYKLNILQTDNDHGHKHNVFCTKIIMLDLDSFFFNDRLRKKKSTTYDDYICEDDELPTNILPIFVRIWSDHSIDIVCCNQPIHPSWNLYESPSEKLLDENYNAIVVCKNYLVFDNDDNNNNGKNQYFITQKCVQNLDELIIGHSCEGLYRLKMHWLNDIPFALNQGLNEYFKLLQKSESNIEPIPLHKFYMNSPEKAYNAMLSDFCISNQNYTQNNDELIILDEHLKKLHVFPLYDVNISKINGLLDDDDDDKHEFKDNADKQYQADIDTKFDLNIMKPFEIKDIEQIKASLNNLIFDITQFPPDFNLSNPKSLKWFIENIKAKIEREIFDKIDLGHLMMNERKNFIENQMNNYIIPQTLLIADKLKQITSNNVRLKAKIKQIMDNHQELENKIKNLQNNMKSYDNLYNDDKSELIRFQCILEDYQKEYNAANYDYQQLNQYKVQQSNQRMVQWTKQDMLHLKSKIKASLTNADQKLKQMHQGLVSLEQQLTN